MANTYALVLTTGQTIRFNDLTLAFNTYNSTSGTGTVNEPVLTDAYIPVYEILTAAFTSDFDFADRSQTGGWVQTGENRYEWGVVLATSDTFEYGGTTRIGVLSVGLMSSTPLTKAQRIENVQNGYYISASEPWFYPTPYVSLKYVTYNQSYDYSKFIFGMTPSDTDTYGKGAMTQYKAYGVSTTYTPTLFENNYSYVRLSGFPQWIDGTGGKALGINTFLMPFFFRYGTNQEYICSGLMARIIKPSSSLAPFVGVLDLEAGEPYGMYRGNCAEYDYSQESPNGCSFLQNFHSGQEPYYPPEYPFEDDYNGGGGGTGDYRDTSDTIPIDGTPNNSALSSGFINAYLLTQQQTIDFHNYLYSSNFLDNVKKLMNDPIDYIISFSLAPYVPETGSASNIIVGGTNSEISATVITGGYKTLDCGTIQLKEFWGKFYDYNPYTKVQIYLPFIGVRPLDIDDVMAGEVNLKYRIDVLTGLCVATVSVNNARGTNGAIYHFNGSCHSQIPVSGKNSLETILNMASAGVGMAGSIARGDIVNATGGLLNVARASKETLEHAGELTGATGLLANFTPFLMVSRPSQSLAQNYNHYHGFISNVTAQLGTLSGYTQVAELVQTNIHCTLDEFEEINDLLKSGVYL